MDGLSKAITAKTPEMEKALKKVSDASGKVLVEQEKLNALRERGNATDAQMIAQSEKLRKAHSDEGSAIAAVNRELTDHSSKMDIASTAARNLGTSLEGAGTKLAALGRVGGAVGALAIGDAMLLVAGEAARASQSLLLLPAAAGAAAVGLGTLKIATLGFGDAMSSIQDPAQFAESLKSLAPNAQQAALSIQNLMPAFESLQQATQNSLFSGVGEQINTLANQYLPMVKDATTSIAESFNEMFSGVTQQLMTPDTQRSMQTFLANTAQAFQNLAPATAPLTKALGDLMATGSTFLPQLATAAAQAAQSFSDFISEAQRSGQLKAWIDEGLGALKQIGSMAWDLGRAFMAMAPVGSDVMPKIVSAIETFANVMPIAVDLGGKLVDALNFIGDAAKIATGDFSKMGDVFGTVADGLMIPAINRVSDSLMNILEPLRPVLDFVGIDLPQAKGSGAFRGGGTVDKNLPTAGIPGAPAGGFGFPSGGGGGSGGGGDPFRKGWFPNLAAPGTWGGGPEYKPYSPDTTSAAATTPYIDPGKFMGGDPMAGMPNPVAGADQSKIYEADSRLITAQNDLAQKKLALQVLETKGNATQQELLTAKNNVAEQERTLYDAQAKDIAARTNQMKQSTSDLQGVFAPLDQDFGISGGIPGIVENLTKLFGNMAMASVIGGSPSLQNAAMQIASSASGGGYAAPPTLGGGGGYGGVTGGYGGDAALLANVGPGHYVSQAGVGDLNKGIGDCTSSIEDLVNILDGQPTAGRSLSTGSAATWLPQHGFVPGMGGLGDFRVGYDGGHMQATLPGGTNFNYGSEAAAQSGGVAPNSGAAYGDQHWYRPMSGGPDPSAMGPAPLQQPGASGIVGNGYNPAPLSAPYQGGPVGGAIGGPAGFQKGIAPVAAGGPGFKIDSPVLDAAGGAADIVAPGSSIALKLGKRAVEFGAQAAGIAASGVAETLLPSGSALGSFGNSWFGKLAGGIAGAKPAKPNIAGGAAAQGGATPPQQGGKPGEGGAQGQQGGTTWTGDYHNHQATEDRAGKDIERHLTGQNSGPGR